MMKQIIKSIRLVNFLGKCYRGLTSTLRPLYWPTLIVMMMAAVVLLTISFSRPIPIAIDNNNTIVLRNQKNVENLLTGWVYDHSEQISIDTARDIVSRCTKTRHPLLMLAMISVESEFKPTAVSRSGAIGLTQVMFKYHSNMLIKMKIVKERRDLFNVDNSIRAGDAIINMYLKAGNGSVEKALERYLGGQDGYYVKRILSRLADLYVLTQGIQ